MRSPRTSPVPLLLAALAFALSSPSSSAFVVFPPPTARHGATTTTTTTVLAASSSGTESEAEALLRRARQLAAEAAADEEALRADLCDKKGRRDEGTDRFIDAIFPVGSSVPTSFSSSSSAPSSDGEDEEEGGGGGGKKEKKAAVVADPGIVKRLRDRRPSTELLLRVVERLHEREISARGLSHVELASEIDHTDFRVVRGGTDEAELNRIIGLTDALIAAAEILDEEYATAKAEARTSGDRERGTMHHAEKLHWAGGRTAEVLREKAADLRREHDEQFVKRQQSYYDAAKRKEEYKDKGELNP